MIRNIKITVSQYLPNWTPVKKRVADRLKLYRLLFTGASTLVSEWDTWRAKAHTKANVTNETISIEWYLNSLYDPALKRIYITTNNATGVSVGLRVPEPAEYLETGLRATEPGTALTFPLRGEAASGIGTFDFGVFIPAALAAYEEEIRAIVKIYSLAGKTFIIIQF